MKRSALVAAIVASLVVGLTIGVQAASQRRTVVDGTPLSVDRLPAANELLGPVNCDTLRCLNKKLTQLRDFVDHFYNCTRIIQVTQYGAATTGDFGYVWDPGSGGATFNTTALDYTVDSDDAFKYFMFWRAGCQR